jgi:hypothetical protein
MLRNLLVFGLAIHFFGLSVFLPIANTALHHNQLISNDLYVFFKQLSPINSENSADDSQESEEEIKLVSIQKNRRHSINVASFQANLRRLSRPNISLYIDKLNLSTRHLPQALPAQVRYLFLLYLF